MHSEEEIKKAINKLAVKFDDAFWKKQYHKAKSCYDTALTVSMFIGLSESEMIELFGDEASEIVGKFPKELVQKAFYYTSVKGNSNRNTETYEDYLIKQRYIPLTQLYQQKK